MALLKNIVHTIELTFSVHVHGSYNPETRIENVQFLLPSEVESLTFQPETLYIGSYKELHHFNLDICILLWNSSTNSGNENGLYLYQSLDPLLLSNCIQQELFNSHKANLKKEEVFHVLQAGYGMQSILDTARTYLQNPITLCTTSFSILAISPKNYLDDKFDLSNTKKYLKKSFIQNMKDIKILQHIFTSHYPITTTFDDSPNTEYTFCSVRIKNATVGYICVHTAYRPFQEEDSSFLVELCKMISIEMQKDDFYAEKFGLKYEYFLTDLLEQNIPSVDFAAKRLDQLGHVLYRYFWILAFKFNASPTNNINPKYYIDQLLGIFKNSMVLYYQGTLIMLLSSKYPEVLLEYDPQKLLHFLQFNHMNYSISYRYENILDSYLYYRQALFLLEHSYCISLDRCIRYQENYLLHLFESTRSNMDLKTLIHPTINFLSAYDAEHRTEYIHTLTAFLESNRNALDASKSLHIHKSTFFYRLSKISELTDFSIDDAQQLFSYEFSLAILKFMNRK